MRIGSPFWVDLGRNNLSDPFGRRQGCWYRAKTVTAIRFASGNGAKPTCATAHHHCAVPLVGEWLPKH
ncbi:MAG TPA: hypothetical protein DIT67_11955 [Octadecabacter sp.]|nr:hypothetical protein [Octadecabacter sp.]